MDKVARVWKLQNSDSQSYFFMSKTIRMFIKKNSLKERFFQIYLPWQRKSKIVFNAIFVISGVIDFVMLSFYQIPFTWWKSYKRQAGNESRAPNKRDKLNKCTLCCIPLLRCRFGPETRVIIEILTHPCYPRNFDWFSLHIHMFIRNLF